MYANAKTNKESFDGELKFEVTLVPCEGDIDWIEPTLHNIKECLEHEDIPPSGEQCEFCPYWEAAGKKLQKMQRAQKTPKQSIVKKKKPAQTKTIDIKPTTLF